MKEKNAPSLSRPEILFLSFFGVGFMPKAPGTWGTLAICPILYLLSLAEAPFFIFIPFLIILTVISCFVAEIVQQKFNTHDPGWIVIDEVIGMWVTWLFTLHLGKPLLTLTLGFALFRFFDIIKFWPATFFDKKVKHGAGTIIDDIISGIYAGLIILIVGDFFPSLFRS